ncbi:TlpA disulfide reductase family protein [Mesonia sp. K4-1]|uniref:TlpA family protein disulfide reductase n=1 Tax=Mesonia sp. K4-1 TaxID=2602760 RepID=UPI0011C828D7|nr:TlpA disulfide reductase family protein [Mesonia sp. K4-1]TXK74913.1 TlpA family protein disulfide reductase [Mesonia sp. K4-1]
MKKILFIFLCFIFFNSYAQEKKMWADSFIGKEAPKLVVEEWLSDEPSKNGKFILIDFWATWCGPCKKAIPDLNLFHKEFKENLVVIGISDESKRKVIKQNSPKIEYYNAIDTQARLKKTYGVRGIPHCVIINPKGIVVWEGWPHLKGYELTSEVIAELIQNN